jgi:hypothetical protein
VFIQIALKSCFGFSRASPTNLENLLRSGHLHSKMSAAGMSQPVPAAQAFFARQPEYTMAGVIAFLQTTALFHERVCEAAPRPQHPAHASPSARCRGPRKPRERDECTPASCQSSILFTTLTLAARLVVASRCCRKPQNGSENAKSTWRGSHTAHSSNFFPWHHCHVRYHDGARLVLLCACSCRAVCLRTHTVPYSHVPCPMRSATVFVRLDRCLRAVPCMPFTALMYV